VLDVAVRVESIRPFACNQMVNILEQNKKRFSIYLFISGNSS
jgi:hypothetical protein